MLLEELDIRQRVGHAGVETRGRALRRRAAELTEQPAQPGLEIRISAEYEFQMGIFMENITY